MRSLSLDQLRTLVAVVEHGSFSAAARRLHLTQPAVSLQIRELERRYGLRLVERQGKQAHATPPGRALVEAAQRIFRECESADRAMRGFRDGSLGSVHVGTTLTVLSYLLPPILRRLRVEHPGIDLYVTQMPTRESVEGVVDNKVHFALVTLPIEKRDLTITPLREETLVAIFPAGTRDIPDAVTPEFVSRQPLLMEHAVGAVRGLVNKWLADQAPLLRATMHLGTIEALKTAVAADLGISIVPEISVAGGIPGIIVRPLDPPLPYTLALIERRDLPTEPALEIVRGALLDLRVDRNASPAEPPSQASLPKRKR